MTCSCSGSLHSSAVITDLYQNFSSNTQKNLKLNSCNKKHIVVILSIKKPFNLTNVLKCHRELR